MKKKMPIRVLQIGMTKNIGGLETYLMQQFDYLDKKKVTYDFVNITSEDEIVFKDKILQAGSHIYGVRSRHSNPIRHYWQWIKLLHNIAGEYKAIVLNSNSITYVFPVFIARFFGIPMRIMHSHNSGFEQKIGFIKKILIAMNRQLLKWGASDYFACSQLAGRWMFGKDVSFRVIPNAIECNKFRFDSSIRTDMRKALHLDGKFVIGHVGRFTYQKNHTFLIEIFREIHKINSRAVLLLIGDAVNDTSYYESAKKQIAQEGLTECVKFLGMRNDVPDLMKAMDCFLLPSRFEGLPVVGIEAQAAGLPCFFSYTITREVGLTELAHFISLEKSPEDWAKKIISSHCTERSKFADVVAEKGYDIHKVSKKMEDIYLRE